MALNIDWAAAIGGAVVGWIASSKVDEVQTQFATTVAAGSAAGVKAAWKRAAKAQAKKAKSAAKAAAGKTGKNG